MELGTGDKKAVAGDEVHFGFYLFPEVVYPCIFGRLKIELPEIFWDFEVFDVSQDVLVLFAEDFGDFSAGVKSANVSCKS